MILSPITYTTEGMSIGRKKPSFVVVQICICIYTTVNLFFNPIEKVSETIINKNKIVAALICLHINPVLILTILKPQHLNIYTV